MLDTVSPCSRLILAATVCLLAACPRSSKLPTPTRTAGDTVEVFTEAGAVNDVAAFGQTLWVATGTGIVSWDLKRATATILTSEDGLPGDDVRALARGPAGALWVATTGGIGQYQGGRWTLFGDCPLGAKISALTMGAGVVYAGAESGLARLVGGRWSVLLRGAAVTGLHWSPKEQVLWVATRNRGLFRCRQGQCAQVEAHRSQGAPLLSLAGDGDRLAAVLGPDRTRILIRWNRRWHRFTARPRRPLDWVHFSGNELLLGRAGSAFTLREREEPESPPGPVELRGETRGAPEFVSRRLHKQLPRHVTVVRRAFGWTWLGSRQLGVARFNGSALQYFRTNDLARDARFLSVACPPKGPCLVCTGARLFRRTASAWVPTAYPLEREAQVQWVGQYQGRTVLVVTNARGGIDVALSERGRYKALDLQPPLRSRQGPLHARFARIGPAGVLWVGLLLGAGAESQGVGLAAVSLQTGAVRIHGAEADLPRTPGSKQIPSDVTGVAFAAGSTYISTMRGVVKIAPDGAVHTYDENSGLPSELVQDLDLAPNGHIWVATPQGLGEYDGTQWHFSSDGPRTSRVSAVRAAPDGTIWFASDSGVHRIRNGHTRSWDDASGLLERSVRHLALDARGRVWLLHRTGLSLLVPRR